MHTADGMTIHQQTRNTHTWWLLLNVTVYNQNEPEVGYYGSITSIIHSI